MKIYNSIRFKIYMIFFIFLVLPLLIVTIIFKGFISTSLLEQTRINDLKTINTINSSLNQLFNTVELSGVILQNDIDVINYMEDAIKQSSSDKQNYFKLDSRNCLSKYSNIITSPITLIDSKGYLIGEKTLDKNRITHFINNSYLNRLSKDNMTWSEMFHIEYIASGKISKVLAALFPMHNKQGIFLGYAVIYLDERRIYNEMSQYQNRVYLLDDTNAIISHQDASSVFFDFFEYSNINYSYLLETTSVITNNKGRKTIVTTHKFNRFDWQTVILTDYSQMLLDFDYDKNYIIVVFLLVFLVSLIIALFISYFLTNPILNITKTMSIVKQGNMEVRNNYKANNEIGVLSTSLNSMLDTINNLINKIKIEQKNKRKIQLQLIQSQIKPHFLYNTLEMMASLIREDMKELGLKSITCLSRFYRVLLSDGVDIITIKQEIELTKNYLELQRLRYIEIFDYDIDIDIETLQYSIPKLTVQPFVENAIYHGLRNKGIKGILKIKCYKKDDKVYFEVFDNGLGIDTQRLLEIEEAMNRTNISNHFGVSSVAKRLELFFGKDISIKYTSELGSYTKVIITMPCKE